MQITSIYSFQQNYNNSANSRITSHKTLNNSISFGEICYDVLKKAKTGFVSGKPSTSFMENILNELPECNRKKITELADAFNEFGVDKYTVLRKMAYQPFLLSSNSDKLIEKIKAYAFVERHKSDHQINDIIQDVINHKNFGCKIDSIYAPMLIKKAFASTKRPDCFVDEGGAINTLKRYYRNNPDTKFDTIEILNDEMTGSFIDFTKRLSAEMCGHENLFNVVVKDNLFPHKTLKPSSADKLTVHETLAYLKHNYFKNQDKAEVLRLYSSLPYRYHANFSSMMSKLKRKNPGLKMYDLMPLYLRNPFFFNTSAEDAVKVIKVKQFVDINSGKEKKAMIDCIKNDFFPSGNPNTYYSHFLRSNMFPDKTKLPWYLRKANSQDVTNELKIFLTEHPDYKLEFEIKDDEMADDFIAYAKNLSQNAIKRNAFDIYIAK